MKYRKRRKQKTLLGEIGKWVIDILIVIAIAFFLVTFIGEKTNIIGHSMEPTLNNGDIVLIDKLIYKVKSPARFDLVVFYPKGNTDSHAYIKRVIGLPGETVQIKDGSVYIDGEKLDDVIEDNISNSGLAGETITLGEDEYFVLGDNRNNSEDSRFSNVGNVYIDEIVGKAWFRVSPFSELGFLK